MNTKKIFSYTAAVALTSAVVFGAVYLRGVRAEQHQ